MITDRAQLKEWFPCDVIVEGGRWEVGAAITFPFPPEVIEMTLTGTVLAVDESKLLSYTWGNDEVLRFELHPEGEGTRLVLSDQLQASWAARNAATGMIKPGQAGRAPRHPDAWPPPVRRLLRRVRAGHRPAGRPARPIQGRQLDGHAHTVRCRTSRPLSALKPSLW